MLIGWRWQSPRSEENVVVLKGLAYLKSELVRVQEQVYVLEDELTKTKKQLHNIRLKIQTKVDPKDVDSAPMKQISQAILSKKSHQANELEHKHHQEVELQVVKRDDVELKKVELTETEHLQKAKLYSMIYQEQKEKTVKPSRRQLDEKTESMQQVSDSTSQADRYISRKYRQVLELAAQGQNIPEISQRLFISQDAVKMVLSMQLKGGA